MTLAEYARYRGVSKAAVSIALKKGRISTVVAPDGSRRIDSDQADKEWAQNSAGYGGKRQKGVSIGPTIQEEADDNQAESKEEAGKGPPTYAASRAFREAYQARLSKLMYEEKASKLVDADKVKVEAFRVGRIVRDSILAVADRISFKLAAETDERKVNLMLKEELTAAMEELVRAGRRE